MGKSWRRQSPYTKAKFQPYTQAVGEFTAAWNDLHEALGSLFVRAVAQEESGLRIEIQLTALWGNITSDRQKRTILEVAMNRIGAKEHKQFPRIAEEVAWIVERGHSLETKRNNVLHSPLTEMLNALVAQLQGVPFGAVVPGGNLIVAQCNSAPQLSGAAENC